MQGWSYGSICKFHGHHRRFSRRLAESLLPPPRNRKRPTLRASVPKRGWAANGTLASDNDSCMPL